MVGRQKLERQAEIHTMMAFFKVIFLTLPVVFAVSNTLTQMTDVILSKTNDIRALVDKVETPATKEDYLLLLGGDLDADHMQKLAAELVLLASKLKETKNDSNQNMTAKTEAMSAFHSAVLLKEGFQTYVDSEAAKKLKEQNAFKDALKNFECFDVVGCATLTQMTAVILSKTNDIRALVDKVEILPDSKTLFAPRKEDYEVLLGGAIDVVSKQKLAAELALLAVTLRETKDSNQDMSAKKEAMSAFYSAVLLKVGFQTYVDSEAAKKLKEQNAFKDALKSFESFETNWWKGTAAISIYVVAGVLLIVGIVLFFVLWQKSKKGGKKGEKQVLTEKTNV